MTTEEPQVETTETPQAESATPEASTAKTAEEVQAELEQVKAALRKANSESAERRKKLEAFEKAEAERKAAEMTETDRYKAEAEQAKAALIEARKMAIAAKHGLPDMLADRLKGETIDELEADALALKETIPAPAKPAPNISPTNPGNTGAAKETDAERRRRLYGG